MLNINLAKQNERPLSEIIYLELRKAILTGQINPGYRLLVLEIANMLNVSQAPVREALGRLNQEGLIITRPNKGSIVSEISRDEVEEIYELRELIEGYVLRKVVKNLTDEHIEQLNELYRRMKEAAEEDDALKLTDLDMEFHGLFYQLSGNKVICDLWNNIKTKLKRFTIVTNKIYFRDLDSVAESHIPLLETLKTRDVDQIEQVFIKHMKEVWWRINKLNKGVE